VRVPEQTELGGGGRRIKWVENPLGVVGDLKKRGVGERNLEEQERLRGWGQKTQARQQVKCGGKGGTGT